MICYCKTAALLILHPWSANQCKFTLENSRGLPNNNSHNSCQQQLFLT